MGNSRIIPAALSKDNGQHQSTLRGDGSTVYPSGQTENGNGVLVQPLHLEPAGLNQLIDIFTRLLPDQYRPVRALLLSPNTVIYEAPPMRAIFMATEVLPNMTAFAHVIVLDKALYRQHEYAKEAIRRTMQDFALHKIYAIIPTTRPLAMRYAETLGFHQEGVLHSALRYNGQWTDGVILGLLEG